MALKRFVDGIGAEPFFQKRAPANRPDWMRVATLTFPSGRTADEIVVDEAAGLAWVANLGCIDLNPHPVRADDLDHPDELRVDLDPVPGVPWSQVRDVALVCREALADVGLIGWPKTSGSRGIHVNVRIERRWAYTQVRRAALALARDVERRAPSIATSRWWKEERHGVFHDRSCDPTNDTLNCVTLSSSFDSGATLSSAGLTSQGFDGDHFQACSTFPADCGVYFLGDYIAVASTDSKAQALWTGNGPNAQDVFSGGATFSGS